MVNNVKLTASELSKAEKCPGSALLPKANNTNLNPDNIKLANKGTIIHKFLELYPKLGINALDEIDKYQSLCALIPVEKIFNHSELILNEVGFRYNILTSQVEMVGEGLTWQTLEPSHNNEITGIADCIIEYNEEKENKILIIDYKTGLAEPAKQNIQLQFLAYCYAFYRAKTKPVENVSACILYIDDAGSIFWDEITIGNNSGYDVDISYGEIALRLRNIHKKVIENLEANAKDCVFQNDNCEYCKSLVYCPIYLNLTKELFEKGFDSIKDELEGLSTNKVSLGYIYSKIKPLKLLISNLESEIKSVAKTRPIQLQGKKKLANVVMKKSQLDQTKAIDIVKKLLPHLDESVIDKQINFQKLAKLYPDKIAEIRQELNKSKAYSYYELNIIKEV